MVNPDAATDVDAGAYVAAYSNCWRFSDAVTTCPDAPRGLVPHIEILNHIFVCSLAILLE